MTDQERQEFMQNWQAYQKNDKVERFRRLNRFVKKGQILFAGSSLMEQFPIYEFLLDYDLPYTIYNRGIGGYTTTEMAAHLEECVFQLEPKVIFINIGTNDLNGPDYEEAGLISRYRGILETIKARLPEARIIMLAYYPVNPEVAIPQMKAVFEHRTNARILAANKAVEQMAKEMGLEYIDLNGGLYDEKGNLKAEYTIEGMHMYANGYKTVLDRLVPVLQSLQIS
ncbi:MAG: lysophospholipase [Firmicutes bacterium]|nr:lysophospholipase [Bacillota bacterium]